MKIKSSLIISLIGVAAILIVALVYFGYIFWIQGNLEHENSENREKMALMPNEWVAYYSRG